MGKLKQQLQKAVRRLNDFDKMKNQMEMTVTAEGLRIELLECDKGTFFDSGSARPSESGKELLGLWRQSWVACPTSCPSRATPIQSLIAGPTDYGNWELSADRANAAAPFHAGEWNPRRPGGAGSRIRRPVLRKPADPLDPANRRISVIVQYLDGGHQVAPKDPKAKLQSPAEGAPAGA